MLPLSYMSVFVVVYTGASSHTEVAICAYVLVKSHATIYPTFAAIGVVLMIVIRFGQWFSLAGYLLHRVFILILLIIQIKLPGLEKPC